jgi:hypothetical protein
MIISRVILSRISHDDLKLLEPQNGGNYDRSLYRSRQPDRAGERLRSSQDAGRWSAMTRFGAALREPRGRIHWFGSESPIELAGYIEKVVRSGIRAAEEVFRRGND